MQTGNIRNIDLNLLKVLDELLRQGSVTEAAVAIGLSQPAVSRALGRLRIIFNDPLFVRSGRKLAPTPFALQIQAPLGKILDDTTRLVSPLKFDPKSAQDVIRINAPDATTIVVLPKVLARISTLAPGLQFVATNISKGRFNALLKGEIDLALDFFDQVPSDFHCQSLLIDRIVSIARKNHPTATGANSVNDYFKWPQIRLTTASAVLIESVLSRKKIYPRFALTVANFIVAASIVAETDWVLMIPQNLGYYAQKLYPLEVMEVPFEIPKFPLDMVWHERLERDQCHGWLRDQISTICQENFKSLQ